LIFPLSFLPIKGEKPVETLTNIEGDHFEVEGVGADSTPIAISPDKRTIYTGSADPEIESLYGKWKRGKLILQPEFQRQYVWDSQKASRLIESVLLSVPLPIIYLAEEADGSTSVIDGQQRLTSFFSFMDGKFPSGKSFPLSGLQVFSELNRRTFQELDEATQDKIRYYEVRAVTIKRDSDPDLKFEIFERLNTGAVPLNDMELRNCVYRGKYIDLLKSLAADPDFKALVGFKEPDTRMRDVELVLRFATFYHATYLKYTSPMKKFFNNDMEDYKDINKKDEDNLRRAFKNSLQIIRSLFGDAAFKRFVRGNDNNPNGAWEPKKFNASLYDVLMGVFWNKDKNQVYGMLDALREAIIDLMSTNEEFIDAILIGTSEVGRVQKRFDLMRLLVDDVLNQTKKQPRCFTLVLKKELFEANPVCAICGQSIQAMDDSAVDHIEQYWRGGKTIPENARLTHRYCNWSRSRTD
jgi:hypothetical protein